MEDNSNMGRPRLTEEQKKLNAKKVKLQTWIDPLTAKMLEGYIKEHADTISQSTAVRLIVVAHLNGLCKNTHTQLELL